MRLREFDSPDAFIHALWPHAEAAAGVLRVDPRVLVAQAALETAWGGSMITRPDGTSSHNLFGIKADSRWAGERIHVPTLEVVDGMMQRISADFRAYESMAASFGDYVAFVTSSPRYADALERAGDPAAYLHALQRAGYATDPGYAGKILDILARPGLPKGRG